MANPPGNYDLVKALNNSSPVARRARLGDWMVAVRAQLADLALATDRNTSLNSGVVNAVGTITMGGSIANGDSYTLAFVNAGIPALVTPGVTLTLAVVTGDTTTTQAAKAAAAINANTVLGGLAITATSAAAVTTVREPGVIGNTTTITATPTGVITTTVSALANGVGTVTAKHQALTPAALNTIA